PAPRYAADKVIKRTRAFREFETIDDFVSDWRMAANHVANVQCRQFGFGLIDHCVALLFYLINQLCTILPAITYLHTHKNSRFVTISVAVIEFGDISLAQRFAEIFISARTLGNSDSKNRFALLAYFGALRDVTQTVKI